MLLFSTASASLKATESSFSTTARSIYSRNRLDFRRRRSGRTLSVLLTAWPKFPDSIGRKYPIGQPVSMIKRTTQANPIIVHSHLQSCSRQTNNHFLQPSVTSHPSPVPRTLGSPTPPAHFCTPMIRLALALTSNTFSLPSPLPHASSPSSTVPSLCSRTVQSSPTPASN